MQRTFKPLCPNTIYMCKYQCNSMCSQQDSTSNQTHVLSFSSLALATMPGPCRLFKNSLWRWNDFHHRATAACPLHRLSQPWLALRLQSDHHPTSADRCGKGNMSRLMTWGNLNGDERQNLKNPVSNTVHILYIQIYIYILLGGPR